MRYRELQHANFKFLKKIGEISIAGVKVRNKSTGEYSMWPVYGPELAWRHLSDMQSSSLVDRFKKKTRFCLYLFIFVSRLIKSAFDRRSSRVLGAEISSGVGRTLVCCFDARMFREIILPLIRSWSGQKKILLVTNFKVEASQLTSSVEIGVINIEDIPVTFKFRIGFLVQLFFNKLAGGFIKGETKSILHLAFRTLPLKDVAYFNASSQIFKKFVFNEVVTADISDARGRIFLCKAHQEQIRRTIYQFGLIDDTSYEYRYHLNSEFVPWGNVFAEVLVRHGIKRENIRLDPSPRFFRQEHLPAQQCSVPQIFFASTYFDRAHAKFFDVDIYDAMRSDVFELASNANSSAFCKAHPAERISPAFNRRFPKVTFISPSDKELLSDAYPGDIFLSFGSTLIFDALIRRMQVITVAYLGWPFLSPLLESGLFNVVKNKDELEDSISAGMLKKLCVDDTAKELSSFITAPNLLI